MENAYYVGLILVPFAFAAFFGIGILRGNRPGRTWLIPVLAHVLTWAEFVAPTGNPYWQLFLGLVNYIICLVYLVALTWWSQFHER